MVVSYNDTKPTAATAVTIAFSQIDRARIIASSRNPALHRFLW